MTFAASFLAGLAVIYIVFGGKIKTRGRSVRYKDQRFESTKHIKSSNDTLIIIAGSVICSGLTYAVTGNLIFTSLALFGGFFILRWHRAQKERERKELLQTQFADVLGQIESALYGGLNPYQAIEDSVPDMPRPARDIFYEVLRRTRSGDTLARALEAVRRETGWEDLAVLSVGMNLYSRTGCNLGDICRSALESYEDKESFRAQVKAAIAQNMMTVKVLTALPFFILGLARAIAPEFTKPLFQTFEGGVVFIFLTGWIVLGNIIIRGMVTSGLGKGV
jgi:Flp pilus assembly protein TadB